MNVVLTAAPALVCLMSCTTAQVQQVSEHSTAIHQRGLLQTAAPVGFLDMLGGEEPALHLEELYVESGSTESLSYWLMDATGYGPRMCNTSATCLSRQHVELGMTHTLRSMQIIRVLFVHSHG
jgi:hypothetical protein